MSPSNTNRMTSYDHKLQIVWPNVFLQILVHLLALQGAYYMVTLDVKLQTFLFGWALGLLTGQGLTAGAHRLWSHKSYKATLPLRILLAVLQSAALQNPIFIWARDHRLHHKYSDTDADPHNANRGFFFSHMGWLMVRKHPDVLRFGKTIDLSDLKADPVVQFQKRYYMIVAPLLCFAVPTLLCWYFWSENIYTAFCVAGVFRFVFVLHSTWLVNSAAHFWGMKPYDRSIRPAENLFVTVATHGEGWHNYHHVFPWDYRAAELDVHSGNLTILFIDCMAKIGWAYDLRTPTWNLVEERKRRTEKENSDN